MAGVDCPLISRRALLAGSVAALGCSHRKATGYRGYCFVANRTGGSIGVIDLAHFRAGKQIPLDAAPAQIVAHPRQPKVLALAPEAGTVFEIDAAKLAVTRRARAGGAAVAMQLSAAGDALWVLCREPAALVEIPLSSMRVERQIRLSSAPDGFDLSADGRAAITSTHGRTVTLASLARGSVERTIQTSDEPSVVSFRKDGRHLFVVSRPERALGIYDVASGRTVVRLPLPVEPRNIAMKPDGGQLFITGAGMDAVVVVYVYQTEIAETLLAGRAPAGMAVMDSPAYLMVTNPETNSVTVLDLENDGKLVASVQVGQEPRAIVVTPAREGQDQYALVLNEKSGDVAVIRLYSLLNQDPNRRHMPIPLFTLIPVGEGPVSAAVMTFA
jgi:DNA-binding beta-propeller fold protein YncE